MGAGQRLRRHVPPLLFLLALTLMLVAIARPAAVVTLPSQHETIILAMDVSGSMRADDVQPNRLVAAQDAASAFIADQPRNVRIGIVSFAGTAARRAAAHARTARTSIAAIDRFQLQRGTADRQRHPGLAEDASSPTPEFDLRSSQSATRERRRAARRSDRSAQAGRGDERRRSSRCRPARTRRRRSSC